MGNPVSAADSHKRRGTKPEIPDTKYNSDHGAHQFSSPALPLRCEPRPAEIRGLAPAELGAKGREFCPMPPLVVFLF